MDILQSDLTFSQNELIFIRTCIDLATISAKDAKFVALVQTKLDNEIQQMTDMLNEQEAEKRRQLEEIKSSSKKKADKAIIS